MKRRVLLWLWLLSGTFAFIYWWKNALISIPLFEAVWTFYFSFDRTDQLRPCIGFGILHSDSNGLFPVLWKREDFPAPNKNVA